MKPTTNPIDDPRKVTVRTVLRRPPVRVQPFRPEQTSSNAGPPTTLRSETPWTPINSTVATQRRTRVKIKESLLARVQGRLLARSTTSAPSVTETSTLLPVTTSTTEESTTLIQEREVALPSTQKPEQEAETTFKLPSEQEEDNVTEEPPEEDVVTETSVSMSIGQSEAHQIVMTTIKNEDTTILDDEEDPEFITTTFKTSTKVPETPKPAEGILGSSLERPDGLQQELLAAIRRKISKSRVNQTKADASSIDTLENEDIEVSPASNSVGSTQQPPFFRYSDTNPKSPFFKDF